MGDKIGHISPSTFDLDEVPVPTPSAFPAFIAAGPDKNLWFTEFSGNQIGRLAPSGCPSPPDSGPAGSPVDSSIGDDEESPGPRGGSSSSGGPLVGDASSPSLDGSLRTVGSSSGGSSGGV